MARISRLYSSVINAKNHLYKNFLRYRQRKPFRDANTQLRENGLNICYDRFIPESYDPELDNVLVAIESPAYVKRGYPDDDSGWIDDEMEFIAEISWEQYTDSEFYFCPRAIYSTFDAFVTLENREFNKTQDVSFVLSDKKYTKGHRLRHSILKNFGSKVDCYGNPVDNFIKEKTQALDSYQFHIAVENTNHLNYISEKFFDPIKTLTIPIYWGSKDSVRKLGFDLDGILFFESMNDLNKILDCIDDGTYQEMLDSVIYNKARLRELRNKIKLNYYLDSSIRYHYIHSPESFNYGSSKIKTAELVRGMVSNEYLQNFNFGLESDN